MERWRPPRLLVTISTSWGKFQSFRFRSQHNTPIALAMQKQTHFLAARNAVLVRHSMDGDAIHNERGISRSIHRFGWSDSQLKSQLRRTS